MDEKLRFTNINDAAAILDIYAPYITDTSITFETEVPSILDFRNRIKTIQKLYPYIVYESDGRIIGYAYASKHRERAAYRYSVDLSIYILPEYQGKGIGKKLYNCLFEILKEQGFYNAVAGITLPNEKSIGIHRSMGFVEVGSFKNIGYKFGKWRDVIYLQKVLRNYDPIPAPIKSVDELPSEFIEELFRKYN